MADDLGFEINSDARGAINALSELMDSLRDTSRTLQDTLNATSQGNIASSIAEQAEAAHAALDGLGLDEFDSQEARLQSAVASASAAFENQAAKINILAAEIERLEYLQDEIDDDDDAAMDRSTIALAKKQLALSQAQQKLASYGVQLEVAKQKLEDFYDSQEEANDSVGDMDEPVKKATKENNTFLAQLVRSVKNITFYRIVRGVIKSITNAAKESANAMAIWSEQFDTGATGAIASFNDNISSIASNLLFARNAIMAAVEPIISALTPAFNMLASAIANAFNMLSHFLSALTGRSFYNKAIKNNVNYANSLKSGSKAQKAFLAGFDELEVVQSSQGGGAGATLGVDPSAMWERAEVESSMNDLVEPFRAALDRMRAIWDEHSEGLKSAASNLWQSIGNLAKTADASFFENFFGEGRIGALLFNDALTLLEDTMNDLSIVINNIIAPFASGFIQGFSDAATVIYKFIREALGPVYDKIQDVFGFIDEHGDTISKISEKIGYVAGVIAAVIAAIAAAKVAISAVTVVIGVLTNPVGLVIAAIAALIAIFVKLYDENEEFRNFVDGIIQWAQEIIPGIIQGIQDAWAGFKQWWKEKWNSVIDWFKDIFGIHSPSTVFKVFGENIVQGLTNGINGFIEKVRSAIRKVKEALDLSKMKETAKGWGSDFVQGLSDGIRRAKELAKSAADAVAQGIASVLHFSRPDEGVLRDYEKWMPDFMRGLANGIDTNADLVYSSVNNLASGMKSAMTVPMLGVDSVSGQFGNDMGSFTQAQMNANASLADVFWQGCMAVVQAINDNQLEVSIGDDVIGKAASRYNRKQAVINGGA
jgi:phage-related protein|nr:MAG TPA: tail tape measure protein [Bacteriophage sp.]